MRRCAWAFGLLLACTGDPAVDKELSDDGSADTDEPWVDPVSYGPVDLDRFERVEEQFDDIIVVSHIPDDPVAVVFFFHGRGGGVTLADTVEATDVLNTLADVDIGYIVTESVNRDRGVWDTAHTRFDNNPDLERLSGIRDEFISDGAFEDDTPILSLGFSNGGSFSGLFAQATWEAGWPTKAASLYNITPGAGIGAKSDVPIQLVLAENDETIDNELAKRLFDGLISAGTEGEMHEIVEYALPSNRMERIEYFDAAQSQIIFDAAVDGGLVDGAGKRAFDIADLDPVLDGFKVDYIDEIIYANMVGGQLRAVWCTHRFNAAMKELTRDFFLSHL